MRQILWRMASGVATVDSQRSLTWISDKPLCWLLRWYPYYCLVFGEVCLPVMIADSCEVVHPKFDPLERVARKQV